MSLNKYFKYFLLILVSLNVFITYSCQKDCLNSIIIQGIVLDSVKNKNLSNATVVLNGCNNFIFNGGLICSQKLATTTTNSKGEFKIDFSSEREFSAFSVEVQEDENITYSALENIVNTNTTLKLFARENSFLKAHIKVNNNPFDTLISSLKTRHLLKGRTVDTILFYRVVPQSENYFIFITWDTKVGGYRRLIDTLQISLKDSTNYFSKPLDVSTFPLN
jgi:hypothetical protein